MQLISNFVSIMLLASFLLCTVHGHETVSMDSKMITINIDNVSRTTLKIVLVLNPSGELKVTGSHNKVRVMNRFCFVQRYRITSSDACACCRCKITRAAINSFLHTCALDQRVRERLDSMRSFSRRFLAEDAQLSRHQADLVVENQSSEDSRIHVYSLLDADKYRECHRLPFDYSNEMYFPTHPSEHIKSK